MTSSTPEPGSRGPHRPALRPRLRHGHRIRHGAARAQRGHDPVHLRQEGRARVPAGVAAQGLPALADAPRTPVGEAASPADRLPGHLLLLRAEGTAGPEVHRRGGPEAPGDLREARHSPARAGPAGRRRRGCGVRQRLRHHHLQGQAVRGRRHLLLLLRSRAGAPGTRPQVPRNRRPLPGQLLRGAELRGVHRRLLRLHPEGRPLPDGTVDVLPDQPGQDRPVRAHADHCRRGQPRQLPRGLHGPPARREPAARGRGRTGGPQGRHHQVLDRAELVSRRRGRPGRHLQLRHQARRLPGRELAHLLDPGRGRFRHHLEVPQLHTARRELRRRVLLRGRHQQPAAGRHRHQDDPHRPQHPQHDRVQGHFGRPGAERLSRAS